MVFRTGLLTTTTLAWVHAQVIWFSILIFIFLIDPCLPNFSVQLKTLAALTAVFLCQVTASPTIALSVFGPGTWTITRVIAPTIVWV